MPSGTSTFATCGRGRTPRILVIEIHDAQNLAIPPLACWRFQSNSDWAGSGRTKMNKLAHSSHLTKRGALLLALSLIGASAHAVVFVNQTPAANGGVARWSKLWVDPSGQNDLDGDAICYEDFTLSNNSTIRHLEWWGDHNPNHGFQIEFWRQDPGTIAYQPLAVFRDAGANPEFELTTTSYSTAAAGNLVHFSLDLPTPVSLAANNAGNPRWFVAVIGLTDVPFLEWNWSQGLGGSTRTYQWIRGEGPQFRVLPEGRALYMTGSAVPEPATMAVLGLGALAMIRRRRKTR